MGLLSTIRTTAQTIVGANGFLYATTDKANVLLDQLASLTYPCIVMLPIEVEDTIDNNGAIKSEFELIFWTLNKPVNPTNDFDYDIIEEAYTEPMRFLARKFIHALNNSSIIDQSTQGITNSKHTRADGVLDQHCFGAFTRTTVPIIETVSVCQ